MLCELKRYLNERPLVSLADIALHLEVDPDVARAMLQRWIQKGRVQRLDGSEGCAGCDLCQPGGREFYRWVGSEGGSGQTRLADRCGNIEAD
jgi:putative ferrous iron transport protein C